MPPPTTASTAATAYLAAASTANQAVAQAEQTWTASVDLSHLQASLLDIAEAKTSFDSALRSLVVPAEDATDMADLLAADVAFETTLRAAAGTSSVVALLAMEPRVISSGQAAVAAANRLRHDLGLPPVP